MKVKVFQTNPNGKIEFTRAELEKLLNEVYDGGFRDGEAAQREKSNWTWTPPYIYSKNLEDSVTTTASSTNVPLTINNNTEAVDNLKCAWNTSAEDKKTSDNTHNVTVKLNGKDISNFDKEAALKQLDSLLNSFRIHNQPNDVFSNLAKELNF
jgi:hypothetical protein